MKKIEIIWRELLFQAMEKKNRVFTQKELAERFGFSTSTVFQALKPLRKMGAVRVTGRNFVLEDPEKLLYHWASVRDLKKDIILQGHVNLPVVEIEGRAHPAVVFGAYSATKEVLKDIPADYDKVYLYTKFEARNSKDEIIGEFHERYEMAKGNPNLFILKGDAFLESYGEVTTIAQTFVDLWNLSDWYAKEFTNALKKKINELLS